jgi:hypothetical protein
MLKSELIRLFHRPVDLARFLGVSRQAVNNWPEEIPELRQYKLRELRPNIDKELKKLRKMAA